MFAGEVSDVLGELMIGQFMRKGVLAGGYEQRNALVERPGQVNNQPGTAAKRKTCRSLAGWENRS
jgi:hypothetical protein